MARIAGVDLPKGKRGVIGLTYVYGIGLRTSQLILERANVNPNKRVKDWAEEESSRIRQLIADEYRVEGSLRGEVALNIKRLIDIGCYRGIRHKSSLPLRGQRTKTNSRTRKGKRKTVAGKKKATK